MRPEEPILHYLNGRWCFEVAGLSWLEKKAAAALFATPPEATYEQALNYFMKSEELNPGTWKANMLMVAKVRERERERVRERESERERERERERKRERDDH